MNTFATFDLVSVGITIITIGILGVLVYISNRKSISNQLFFLFCLIVIFWSCVNYLSYQAETALSVLWLLRFTIFFGLWQIFFLYQLFIVFPLQNFSFSKSFKFILVPYVIIVSLLTLSPATFAGVQDLRIGQASVLDVKFGIGFFGATVVILIMSGIVTLIKKLRNAKGVAKKQFVLILLGTIFTYVLIIFFNFILPVVFEIVRFIPLGATFTFPLIAFTAYASIRYSLFDVKVIATQLFTFSLWIFLLIRTLLSDNSIDILINTILLALTVIIGIFLIRSVIKEVNQREEMEDLAKRLKDASTQLRGANAQLKRLDQAKSDFISIASHQLRTPLTVIKGYISMIQEGSFGKVPDKIDQSLSKVYASNERLITLVENLLDISRIESGRQQFDWVNVDLVDLARRQTENLMGNAKANNLKLTFQEPKEKIPIITAEYNKLHDVIINFIDNAIKYTKQGSIDVSVMMQDKDTVTFCVADTGRGIEAEVLPELFKKFARGTDSFRVNAGGTGLGLYVAKMVIDAHEGKVWAESDGKDKGSKFCFSIPVKGPKKKDDLPFAQSGQKVANPVKSEIRNIPNAPQPSITTALAPPKK